MGSATILAFVIGAFLIVNLLVGLWAGRGVNTVEEYVTGKKKWGSVALVMTFLATILDGGVLIRESETFITVGIMGFVAMIGATVSHFIRSFILANQISRFIDCNSIGDIVGKLYGRRAKILVGFLASIYSILIVALQIRALSIVFVDFLGFEPVIGTIISGTILALYTAFGGMKAVITTDILQFIMTFGALGLIAVYSLVHTDGLFNMIQKVPSNLKSFELNENTAVFWSIFLVDALFSFEFAEPARLQRLLLAKNSSSFTRLSIFAGLGNFIGIGLILVASLSAFTITNGNLEGENPIHYVVKNLIPAGFYPFIIVGIIAIIFSSGDSWLHCAGINFSKDFFGPLFNKEVSLKSLKLTVLSMGLFAILLTLQFQELFLNLGTLLSFVAPIVTVPVFWGFLGIKTSSKMFWSSTLAASSAFVTFTYLLPQYASFAIIIACTFSLIAYFGLHLIENGKIIFVGNPIISQLFSFTNLFNRIKKFYCGIDESTNREILFYSLYGVYIIFPYLFFPEKDLDLTNSIFYLRSIGVLSCVFMTSKSIWPTFIKTHHRVISICIATFNTIFLPLSMFIIFEGKVEYLTMIIVSFISLFFLFDWFIIFVMSIVGTIMVAIFMTHSFIENISNTDSKSLYILLSQGTFAMIFGLLLARKRDRNMSKLDSKTNFLELIQTNSISSLHKSMTLQKREEDQFNHFMNLPSAKDKISEMIKNYRGSINEHDLNQDLLQLSEAIESEERTKIYQVLTAKKYKLSELTYKSEDTMKIAGCEDVSINIFTKKDTIRCDETVFLKMLYKISNDYCKKIFSENSGDDADLVLSFFDTKILYESDEENGAQKLFSRTIDGVAIVISEKDINKENKIVKNLYTKKLTDLEAISESSAEDINFIDIEKGIDAHYGLLENHSDSDYLTWVCVIPADVYEIRPETLDMTEPINVKYNWPAAVELEKKFVKELQNFENLNMSKIEYAVSVIKKYHFHQTRKSGEPYYMHPINVALIVLDIIKEGDTGIYEELKDNIENLVIAALLHDILEDTAYSRRALTRNFGPKVRDMVLAVTKIDHSNRAAMLSNKQAFQDLIDKDPLSLCIKLADRLHNILTIDGHPKVEKRKAVAQETLDFFVPPAEKYGLNKLAGELKNMSEYILEKGKLEGWGW